LKILDVFEILKNEVKAFLTEYGIIMHTKTNTAGNLSVSHYRTLLQKLTAVVNKDLQTAFFPLPQIMILVLIIST
jgi:hypothetical protein